jgi:hypothetical protein
LTQNSSIITSFTDGQYGSIAYSNNVQPIPMSITQAYGYGGGVSISGLQITGQCFIYSNSVGVTCRVNIKYPSAFQIASINYNYGSHSTYYGSTNFALYTSNSSTYYNDTSGSTTGLTLQNVQNFSNASGSVTYNFTDTNTYQYIHCICTGQVSSSLEVGWTMIQVNKVSGGYSSYLAGTDYSITTDLSTGSPKITYTDFQTTNFSYVYERLVNNEMYRRIYPVIHDVNNIYLGNTGGWNIQNSSGTLQFNYNSTNEMSLSSGGNLTLTGTLPSITKHGDVTITSVSNNQVLTYSSGTSKWINASIPNMSFVSLSDVSISGQTQGQIVMWNNSTSKWNVENQLLNNSTDVVLASGYTLSNGDNLQYWNSLSGGDNRWHNVQGVINKGDLITFTSQPARFSIGSTNGMFLSVDNTNAYGMSWVVPSFVTSSSLTSTLASYVTSSSLTSTLSNYETTTNLSTTLSNYSNTSTCNSNYASIASPTFSGTTTFNSNILINNAVQINAGNPLINLGSQICSISSIQYINATMFSGSPSVTYQLWNYFYAYVIDISNTVANCFAYLPILTDRQSIYIQVGGTPSSYYMEIRDFNANAIGTDSSYSIYQNLITGNTYKLTYYVSSGNPGWANNTTYPNWYIQQLGSNIIPLQSNIYLYLLYTNTNSLTSYLGLSMALLDGLIFKIKDANGHLNNTQVQLSATNSNLINNLSTITLSTNNQVVEIVYVGSSSNCLILTI